MKHLFSSIALKRKIETKDSLTNGLHATLQKKAKLLLLKQKKYPKKFKKKYIFTQISFLTATRRNIETKQPNIISILIF